MYEEMIMKEQAKLFGLLKALKKSRIFTTMLKKENIESMQKFLKELLNSGIIGKKDYKRLSLELANLVMLSGEEYERKAKEILEEIRRLGGISYASE